MSAKIFAVAALAAVASAAPGGSWQSAGGWQETCVASTVTLPAVTVTSVSLLR